MEIKIELDLPAIISQAVSAERIQPIVDKAISEVVSSAIRDATGYNSPFRESLKKQLTEAMPHGLAIDDVAKFQLVLNQAVKEAVHGANAATVQTAIKAGVADIIPEMPAIIKLSELLNAARAGFHKEGHEDFYAKYEQAVGGFGHIFLDEDSNKRSKYFASTQIDITKNGEAYAVKFHGQQLKDGDKPQHVISHFDALLIALYTGRTKIEVDIDADDVEAAAEAQHD